MALTEATASRKEIVNVLYTAAFKYFRIFSHRKTSVTFKEVHLTPALRVDIMNLSYDERVVIVELKTCRDDFKKDNKWKGYMNYCDRFMFMCPSGVILEKELPSNVGLIYVDIANPSNPGIRIVKKPGLLKPKKLNSAWFKYIFKKLAFKKFAIFNNKLVSLGEEVFFP